MVRSAENSNIYATCTVTITPNAYMDYTKFTSGTDITKTLQTRQHQCYKFTPTVTGEYTFMSEDDTDTYVEIYLDGNLLQYNDNGSGDG